MQLIRGWHNLNKQQRGCVLTMGNFDGLHRGHQLLIQRLVAAAKQFSLPSVVMIFEPQPNEFFQPRQTVGRLMRLREKIEALTQAGVDRVLVVRFNAAFSQVTADEFIKKYLCQQLGARHIIVGDDFHFGFKRQGNSDTLIAAGLSVEKVAGLNLLGERVSSTRIRQVLEQGDLMTAEALLGRRFFMSGRVAHGDKLGRTIGFPTANIHLHRLHVPISGVVAVQVFGVDEKMYLGVANVGNRPTVNGEKVLLEVYLFDFDRDIYGKHLHVEFVRKIRDELRFESVEAMRLKIVEDVAIARKILCA